MPIEKPSGATTADPSLWINLVQIIPLLLCIITTISINKKVHTHTYFPKHLAIYYPKNRANFLCLEF